MTETTGEFAEKCTCWLWWLYYLSLCLAQW